MFVNKFEAFAGRGLLCETLKISLSDWACCLVYQWSELSLLGTKFHLHKSVTKTKEVIKVIIVAFVF